jgi:hypothetical protein
MYARSGMATTSHLHPMNTSLAARDNISLTLGSHIWFGSLEFIITKEGNDLDLVPPTNELAHFLEPVVDLQRRSDELKNTCLTNSACPVYHELPSPATTKRFAGCQLMFTISAPKQVKYRRIYHNSSDTPSSTPWHRQR